MSPLGLGEFDTGFDIRHTNGEGHFVFRWEKPGEYVLGARRPDAPGVEVGGCSGETCADRLPTDIYYFGNTSLRKAALVIKLGVDEKRDDVEIVLPSTEPEAKP